jgi:flagellar basal-body rod modification protein FlgD
MAAAAAGIFSHQLTAGQALTGKSATPLASATTATGSTSDSSDSSSSSATISANDFLTLLVTEMQNQDPTADTDPNEYISQLVQVNSLEQLIDINQNLTTALGDSPTSSGTSSTSSQAAGAASNLTGAATAGATAQARAAAHNGAVPAPALSGAATPGAATTQAAAAKRAPGNLSVPNANPAAHRVAHALDGRSHAQPMAGGLSGAQ